MTLQVCPGPTHIDDQYGGTLCGEDDGYKVILPGDSDCAECRGCWLAEGGELLYPPPRWDYSVSYERLLPDDDAGAVAVTQKGNTQ